MALDVGERRIGVALSDPTGLIASVLTTVTRTSEAEDIKTVLRLAAENGVGEIVVGLPLSLSGGMGPQARLVSGFTETLSRKVSVEVKSLDERYSSVEAERLLREGGIQPSRDRARVDAVAAAVVLQSYLDSRGAARDR